MKILNKFIWSKKEPSNKNDIWFDGSTVRLYKEGEWYTVTLSKEAIERLLQYAENVDIFKYVNELPEVGDPTFIYFKNEESNGNLIVLPYVYDGEWKQITNTEVFGESSPFGFGEAENSAVLKGGNNQVISENGVAFGSNNVVGLKGFYYKHIRFVSSTLANIYLSETQVIPTITTGGEIKDKTIIPANYLSKGDIISIVNDNKYNDVAEINNMSEGMIQIKWVSEAPFSSIKTETNLSPEDYSIYCLDKPTQGISDLGKYSFANGTNNKAINTYTEVSGKGNVVKGKFGKVWGKDNIGGYNTTTFGTNNTNLADNSLVNGTNNINEGSNSVIHGNKNKNYGKRAFVVGNENITNNENEAAFGKYNNSKNDTQFSIGIGTSEDDRKNAFEVKQNGDIYIEGVEGRIQDKLNTPVSVTPNWNARKGEAGYIENKPFVKELIEEGYFEESGQSSGYFFENLIDVSITINGERYSDLHIGDFTQGAWSVTLISSEEGYFLGYSGNGGEESCVYEIFKLIQIDEDFIPDTIARKSDLENAGSSSSNEYIITTFTYYGVKNVLNESGYFEHIDNEVLNQIKSNKTIYIKSDSNGGKILCNYIIEGYDFYRLICNDLDLFVRDDGTISCSSLSINHNAIITDFTADMIENAHSDNNSVETYTNFEQAFSSNPIPIIIPKGYDNDGYVHALCVDGQLNYFNLGFIYHDYYYVITVNSDMYQISTIKRAPMPAFE